ncbi:MAG: peptidyl-prolyl cis-trans isomerase [Campylobacterales bacterium]|nr:peptidyl-prolyl cis-trans isomerase [Campylobacterales bacterium]
MKKLILLLLLTPLLFAEIINAIAVTVDNETITLYEIKQEQALSQLSIKETVDQLIRAKLEEIEAKKRQINVSNQEILDELKKMAEQNNMSLSQLYEAMSSSRHLSESQTKEKTKEKLLKQKLFDAIAMAKMDEPTDQEVEEYYHLHLKEYALPKSIDAVLYSSADQNLLREKIANPMMSFPGVSTENMTIELAKVNPRLAEILINTDSGSFTPVLPQMGGSGYISFYLLRKNETVSPELEQIKEQVEHKIMQDKREQILNEHFQRMRVNADIKVLRLPK